MSLSQNIMYASESVTLTDATTAAVIRVQANSILAVYTRGGGSTVIWWDGKKQKIAATQSRATVSTQAGNTVQVTPQSGNTGAFNMSIGAIQDIVTDGATGSIIKWFSGGLGYDSLFVTESPSALQTTINAASPAGSFVTTNTNQTIPVGAAKTWTDAQIFDGGILTDTIENETSNGNITVSLATATGAGQAGGIITIEANDGIDNAGANPGGNGGSVTVLGGLGGESVTGTGGEGGEINLTGRSGGDTTGVGGVGGNGSTVSVSAGNGGNDIDATAGNGGDGGHVVLTPGEGGSGNTAGREGELRFRDYTGSIQAYVNSTGFVGVSALQNEANSITVAPGTTMLPYGDGKNAVVVINFAAKQIGAGIPGAGNLALGTLIGTLPAGYQVVEVTRMDVALNGDVVIQADTPDVGIGSELANGAVAVLGGTAAFEDYITGQTAADVNGTVTRAMTLPTAGSSMLLDSLADKTIYLNMAANWTGLSATLTATGSVTLKVTFMD